MPQLRSTVILFKALRKSQIDFLDSTMHRLISYINFNLVMLPMSSGMVSAFSMTFLKAATIAFDNNGFTKPGLYIYAFLALLTG